MKSMPWQDILTVSAWSEYIRRFRNDELASAIPNRPGPRRWGRKPPVALPEGLAGLSHAITNYHGLDKRSGRLLPIRKGLLTQIAAAANHILVEHRLMRQGMSMGRKIGEKGSLEYVLSKLVRRALRKADYLDKLKQHLDAGDRGFCGRGELLDYLRDKFEQEPEDGLARLVPSELMERIDPWHRPYALQKGLLNCPIKSTTSLFGVAFYEWANDFSQDIPFFLWLEGNYICTGVTVSRRMEEAVARPGMKDFHRKGLGSVHYGNPDPSKVEVDLGVNLVSILAGQLYANALDPVTMELKVKLMDTQTSSAKGIMGGQAYVWTREGIIMTADHEEARFHHSSFVSGKKVRCAGMIVVHGGKVVYLDNNSGHYRPPKTLLDRLVSYLLDQNAFHRETMVMETRTSRGDTDPRAFLSL